VLDIAKRWKVCDSVTRDIVTLPQEVKCHICHKQYHSDFKSHSAITSHI
jgi:hypothetical protein